MAATNFPALAPMRSADLLVNLGDIERVAKACAASGYYKDVRDVSQAVVKMLAGREMGIGPIQALAGIYIVEGKPSASANLIAANVKRSGRYDYRVKRRDNEACALEWFEGGVSVGLSEFTMEDAQRAGLAGRGNWSKYPRAMLFARALTEGVRVYCPDAAAGIIYTPEELAPDITVTEDGDPVNMPAPEPRVERDVTPKPEPERLPNPAGLHVQAASKAQVKRFWALCAARAEKLEGVSRTDIARDVLGALGIEHSDQIPLSQYDRICHAVSLWDVPSPGAEPAVDDGGPEF